ncbi:MAG: hypothetical protein EXQ86_02570 [Rhodospirillales bacterium]|nr:hypothetical protein [Rhodospirillales bacterium]
MRGAAGFVANGFRSLQQYGLGLAAKVLLFEVVYETRFRSATSRLVAGDDLDIDEPLKRHGSPYLPSPYYFAHRAFRALGGDVTGRSLIDFGCGLGRVLLFASQFPFRKIIGVEASPTLSEGARANLRRYYARVGKTAPGWSIESGDAAKFAIPDDADVFYFGDPFGPAVLDPVVRNIVASIERRPRPATVLYVHPAHSGVFQSHGFRAVAAEVNPQGRGFMVLTR